MKTMNEKDLKWVMCIANTEGSDIQIYNDEFNPVALVYGESKIVCLNPNESFVMQILELGEKYNCNEYWFRDKADIIAFDREVESLYEEGYIDIEMYNNYKKVYIEIW